jgi:hypothetical protein
MEVFLAYNLELGGNVLDMLFAINPGHTGVGKIDMCRSLISQNVQNVILKDPDQSSIFYYGNNSFFKDGIICQGLKVNELETFNRLYSSMRIESFNSNLEEIIEARLNKPEAISIYENFYTGIEKYLSVRDFLNQYKGETPFPKRLLEIFKKIIGFSLDLQLLKEKTNELSLIKALNDCQLEYNKLKELTDPIEPFQFWINQNRIDLMKQAFDLNDQIFLESKKDLNITNHALKVMIELVEKELNLFLTLNQDKINPFLKKDFQLLIKSINSSLDDWNKPQLLKDFWESLQNKIN